MKHHVSLLSGLSIHFLAKGTIISIIFHYHKICIPKKAKITNTSIMQKTAFYALYNISTSTILSSLMGIRGLSRTGSSINASLFQTSWTYPHQSWIFGLHVLCSSSKNKKRSGRWCIIIQTTRSGLFSPFTGGLMNCPIFITHVYYKLIVIMAANDKPW